MEPFGIQVLSPADLYVPVPARSEDDPLVAATAGAAYVSAATSLPAIGAARSFVIDPLPRHDDGGLQWRWPVPWPGTQEELAKELFRADTTLTRGGYCGPDDRCAYCHTVLFLLWPDARSWLFEGRMDGQFMSLARQRMKSSRFMTCFADCFVPEAEEAINRPAGSETWNLDQRQAIDRLRRAMVSS